MMYDRLLTLIRRWRDGHPPMPDRPLDPDAGVRHPRWRGPAGRESAMAVPEPAPDVQVDAVAHVPARTEGEWPK
jgi:hypothetical protein